MPPLFGPMVTAEKIENQPPRPLLAREVVRPALEEVKLHVHAPRPGLAQARIGGPVPSGQPLLFGVFQQPLEGLTEIASLRLRLTFAFVRHSGESQNPFSALSLAFRPDALSPDRGRFGRRHINSPHPFRIRARRSFPRAGVKSENENKNHIMDSGFRRNDGGFPTSRGFFNNPPQGGKGDAPAEEGGFSTTPGKERLLRMRNASVRNSSLLARNRPPRPHPHLPALSTPPPICREDRRGSPRCAGPRAGRGRRSRLPFR